MPSTDPLSPGDATPAQTRSRIKPDKMIKRFRQNAFGSLPAPKTGRVFPVKFRPIIAHEPPNVNNSII